MLNLANRPIWLFPVIAGLAALLGVFAFLLIRDGAQAERTTTNTVRVSGEADIGGPFTLVDHTGATVTEADFEGRPMLVYFGFTYCPDVCPFSLQLLDSALETLPEDQREEFQSVLISVDPARDTPEVLAQYILSDAFPENMTGLTGSEDQVRAAANAYKVYFQRADDSGSASGYLVDHTSLIFLMDREGGFVDIFTHDTAPDQIAARLQRFLEESPPSS